MIAKKRRKKHRRSYRGLFYAVIIVVALVFFSMLFFGALLATQQDVLEGRFYPHIYVDSIDISKKSREEAVELLRRGEVHLKAAGIKILYEGQPIATFSAQTLKIKRNSKEVLDQAYRIGREKNPQIRASQRLAAILNMKRYYFTTDIVFDKTPLLEFIQLAEQTYNKPARNARFAFSDGRVTSFAPEEKGEKLDSQKFISDVTKTVKTFKSKPSFTQVILRVETINPEITLSSANKFGIEELIGEGRSNFAGSIPGRIHNLTLAASKFNGILIPPGETLSFNDTVGDISSLTGYQQAYIIKGGRTVLGDGGGVCQVSTTLFRAALRAGLPIIERTAHAYRVGYYENDSGPGFDATVYAPSVDLKIKNDTLSHILIQTHVDAANSLLIFDLYGKKDGRVVYISEPTVTDQVAPPPPLNQDDPTLKRGVTKQVDFPAWGAKAFFSYKVTKNNAVLTEKTFFSAYRPWQAVYLVGVQD